MENKKYELVEDDFILHEGKKLYRIKAIKDFFSTGLGLVIRKGDLGGYVEGCHNLSQEGDCWIGWSARTYGNARVKDRALVCQEAEVFGNAVIEDRARVGWRARIYDNAVIKENSIVKIARVYGNAVIKGSAVISRQAEFHNNTVISSMDV